ncbi:DSBA oxidoreductase [Burkholderia multivorans]
MSTLDPDQTSDGARPGAALTIDVMFDFVCPWCLIGKRQLDRALTQLADTAPDVRPRLAWHGVQLLPDTPLAGTPYQAFYVARLGSEAAVAARREQVHTAARAAGLELAFERIRVMPNTGLAHRVAAHAATTGTPAQHAALIDSVFTAYFIDGKNIGDADVLVHVAERCGLAADAVRALVASAPASEPPSPAVRLAASRGVPAFLFNGTDLISGAVPADALGAAMHHALGR